MPQANGTIQGTAFRVVCIDDDETLLALARLVLAKQGIDVVLPDLSGWETIRRIRERSNVPVMLLSGRDSDVDKARGLDLDADDYLTKLFSLIEVEARVRMLLRRARTSSFDAAPVGSAS